MAAGQKVGTGTASVAPAGAAGHVRASGFRCRQPWFSQRSPRFPAGDCLFPALIAAASHSAIESETAAPKL